MNALEQGSGGGFELPSFVPDGTNEIRLQRSRMSGRIDTS